VITGHGQRDQGGEDPRGHGVTEGLGEAVARAIGAGFGKGHAAGGEDDAAGGDGGRGLGAGGIIGAGDHEAGIVALDCADAPRVLEVEVGVVCRGKEGIQDGVGIISCGEELAGVLAFEGDAELLEELDGAGNIEAAEDLADGVAAAAGVLLLINGVVGDVAAAAAGDEDFGPELFGTVEGDDAGAGAAGLLLERAAGPDAGEEAGSTGADDRDVDGVVQVWRVLLQRCELPAVNRQR